MLLFDRWIITAFSSFFSSLDSVESQTTDKETTSASDVPEESYYNDTLTSNMTFLETDPEGSPLPTQITELDKIIRAGMNLFLFFNVVDFFSV